MISKNISSDFLVEGITYRSQSAKILSSTIDGRALKQTIFVAVVVLCAEQK
jgi:hypothetical protein